MTAADPVAALGLPSQARACLFDLDGVLTQTAKVHAAAWKQTFDDFLAERSQKSGEDFLAFDDHHDYDAYVDGKPRFEGTSSFLASRGIDLPTGNPDDDPGAATIHGLGNTKNELVLKMITQDGVQTYESSIEYVRQVRRAGLATAVVSSSANCRAVLVAAGIEDLFDARVDGVVAEDENLEGKPAPDTFLAGAARLGVAASQCVVFEDALAGVEAGRAGGFALVVGVDRAGQAEELKEHGADLVVTDLGEMTSRRD
ncbi:MAG: beta-phosphoglucomutase family hydrolase [Acidimicrobiales bacterium]